VLLLLLITQFFRSFAVSNNPTYFSWDPHHSVILGLMTHLILYFISDFRIIKKSRLSWSQVINRVVFQRRF
jgi:hypothetical protein